MRVKIVLNSILQCIQQVNFTADELFMFGKRTLFAHSFMLLHYQFHSPHSR